MNSVNKIPLRSQNTLAIIFFVRTSQLAGAAMMVSTFHQYLLVQCMAVDVQR